MHTRPIAHNPSAACLIYLGLSCVFWLGPKSLALAAPAEQAPEALPACTAVVPWQGALPQNAEESVRYGVAVDGLSVGTVDFQIARTGVYSGKAAVEYRSLFKLDHLLATMADIQGRAASLVWLDAASPHTAMSHYSMGNTTWHEELAFAEQGRQMRAVRRVTPAPKRLAEPEASPPVAQPIVDFVTGFYLLRRLPAKAASCMTVYINQHHYVVWATPQGSERVKTPVGMRPADIFAVRYQRMDGDAIGSGRIWLSQTEERLPYQFAIGDDRRIEVRLHTYAMGRSPGRIKPPYSVASD